MYIQAHNSSAFRSLKDNPNLGIESLVGQRTALEQFYESLRRFSSVFLSFFNFTRRIPRDAENGSKLDRTSEEGNRVATLLDNYRSVVNRQAREFASQNIGIAIELSNFQNENDAQEYTSTELLCLLKETLDNNTVTDIDELILLAETTDFEDKIGELLPVLYAFILKRCDSSNLSSLVSAGSAIRKYVSCLPIQRINGVAELLNRDLTPNLELELIKMLVRKFTANPPSVRNQYPDLGKAIYEAIVAYLNPRVQRHEKINAILLNGIVCLVAMRSSLFDEILVAVKNVSSQWFKSQLIRRFEKLEREWAPHSNSMPCDELIDSIRIAKEILA